MKHTKKALFFRLLWYIIMILVSLVFCFPVLYLIFTGFKTPQETVAFPPTLIPKKWTLSAYEEGLSSGIFSNDDPEQCDFDSRIFYLFQNRMDRYLPSFDRSCFYRRGRILNLSDKTVF